MYAAKLPLQNEYGMYEIRLESIGGLGANLCGKMLGELAIRYLGLNSAGFSSYGSEKTGTPVKSFIRFCDSEREIRVHSPVIKPHLLCIFHEALLQNPESLCGCSEETTLVVNTALSGDDIMRKLSQKEQTQPDGESLSVEEKQSAGESLSVEEKQSAGESLSAEEKQSAGKSLSVGKWICIDATAIAMETKARINVIMLGAMAKAMGFVSLEDVCRICEESLGRKYPSSLSNNIEGIRCGYAAAKKAMEIRDNEIGSRNRSWPRSRLLTSAPVQEAGVGIPKLGYLTAPIGGINIHIGNSVISDLSPSRQGYVPRFLKERCINCGLCDSTCPDMVFQFERGVYKGREMMVNEGLDYRHCKGCLRCVAICPTQALVKAVESEVDVEKETVPNRELLRKPDYYEKTGADAYINSESFLTEIPNYCDRNGD